MANNNSMLPGDDRQELPVPQVASSAVEEQPTRPVTSVVKLNSSGADGSTTKPIPTVSESNPFALNGQPTRPGMVVSPLSSPGKPPVPGAKPLVSVRNVKKTYVLGQTLVPALRGVSLDVYPGEFVAIMGPSGSGKSTFMNLLGCLDRPTEGEYRLAGKLVSTLSSDELADIRNRLIGFVFQGFNLLSRATALSNVALPMIYAGLSREEREERARKMLKLVGLGSRLHHKPSQLSGGQQQRVAIARALVNGPSLLMADEPTGNLDSRTSIEIMAILQALNQQGLTIVLVTHEPDIAAYAKRRVTFRDGRIISDEPILAPRSAVTEWAKLAKTKTDGSKSKVQVKEEVK